MTVRERLTRAVRRERGVAPNSRRRGDSKLLIAFCNIRDPKPCLAVVDLADRRPEPRFLDIREGSQLRGARGLCLFDGLVCVGHQQSSRHAPVPAPPGFVLLDPEADLRQVDAGDLPGTPHSACYHAGALFFTMSREDSVYRAERLRRGGGWEVTKHWTMPGSSGDRDENHVNAIEVIGGGLCVSATGKKAAGSELWASAKRGFVFDLERGRYLMNDLLHPHSLLAEGAAVWTCETRASRVVSNAGEEIRFPGGAQERVRGLAMNDRHLYVGVSKDRTGSKSQGTFRGYEGACGVYRVPRDTGRPEMWLDLTDQRDEIYELMLL